MSPEARQPQWKILLSGAAAVAAFLAAVATVISLFDPFGGGQDRIAAAATKVTDAGSSQITMSATVRIGSQTLVDYHAQGAFNYRDESGRLDDSNGQHMFFNRPYAYLMPAGSHVWCQYDLTSLGRGFLLGALGGFKDDPADTLVNLKRFGSYKTVGDERLFGVKTTHYVGHINLSRLRNQPPNDPATQQQLDAISAVNAGKLPVDVWLSSDNVVSRLGTSFNVPAKRGTANLSFTFDFSNFGTSVRLPQVPRSQIASAGTRGCPSVFSGLAR